MLMRRLVLLTSLALVILASHVSVTTSSFIDSEVSLNDTFGAGSWIQTVWTQTTQGDFEAGVLTNVDSTSNPGDLKLATTTTTLGDSANNAGDTTDTDQVLVQTDGYATVPYNGEITSWTYYDAGTTSNGARLELLSGSDTTWTMMAKSNAVTITGTDDTFAVSIPVQAGWSLGMYSGSASIQYDDSSGTVSARAEDFNVEVTESDFSQSTGHLALTADLRYYYSSGTIASPVLDTEDAGSKWRELSWDETLQTNTNITFEVRASDTSFAKDDVSPSWTSVGETSPVTSGLPSGRYKQWRSNLTTTDTSVAPTLNEVSVCYF